MKTFKRDENSQFIFQEIMVGDGDNTNELSLGISVLLLVILNGFRAFKNTFS